MFKNFIWLFTFLVISTQSILAQEQLKHPAKFYVAENGKFYVNRNKGYYMWISDSPNPNAPKHLLQSNSTPQYANPMYFDTEGYNSYHTPFQVDTVTKKTVEPKKDLIFEIYADGSSPVSTVHFGKSKSHKAKNLTYFGKDLNLSFTAKDDNSGVENIYVSTDGASYTKFDKPITFTKEKKYAIKYYAVDNVGNVENPKITEFALDITPPISSYDIDGTNFNNIYSPNATLSLSATDTVTGVAKIVYSFDDSKNKVYQQEINLGALSEGEHTLHFYAVDNVHNEEKSNSYSFFLDKSAPIVVEEVMGDQFFANGKEYTSGRTKLKLTAVDNKAGVKAIYYSLNNGEWQTYDKPFYFSAKQGTMSIRSYAVDNVGNKSEISFENKSKAATYIDLTGPSLDYSYNGAQLTLKDTVYISKKTKIKLFATDKESGVNRITYTLDKGEETTYGDGINIEKEGFHTIEYFGYDNVNNSNQDEFFFVVDNTGPEIFARFGILSIDNKKTDDGRTLNVYPDHVALFLSATDKYVGYDKMYYSVNGGPEKLYAGTIFDFLPKTEYKVKVRALDKLGNESTKDFEFFAN